jgi:hypothetical protein
MLPAEPRHFMPSPALPGAGLPSDRLARIAARRTFVGLKLMFQDALATRSGTRADWLREQIRAAEEPSDLWLLRAPVFAELAGTAPAQRACRHDLRRALATLFPDSDLASAFSPF